MQQNITTMQIQVPMSIMRDLKCRHCTSFVSCGPVYVVPDGGILCGRCNMIAKPQFRNTSYETLATCFLFPCHNWSKYCGKQLQWNEAVIHEEDCTYRSKCQLFCNHPAFFCKPERKISLHDDFQLQHIPDKILTHLECYICSCYLSCDPVYISDDGKNICHRCINNNGIPHGVLRNLAYEKLASFTIFPCVYKKRGCTMRLPYGKELWRHESDCSYGQTNFNNNKNPQNKKHMAGGKERGVVMTHSGHIYATITPQSALWAPPQRPNNVDPNFEINKEFADKVRRHTKDEIAPKEQAENFAEENYDSFISNISKCSRRTSTSSDSGRKCYSGGVSPRVSSPPPTNFSCRDDSIIHSYYSSDVQNFPRYSTQYNERSGDDIARPSLPGNFGSYRSNVNYMNYRNNDDMGPKSLEYNSSVAIPRPITSELIKPKRADSFKVGNQMIIDELRVRQSLSTGHRTKSVDSDRDSVISGSTFESIGNNEVYLDQPKVLAH